MHTVHYSLRDFEDDCLDIAKKLASDGFHPDVWIALDRGGTIAAATIRRMFSDAAPDVFLGSFIVKHKEQAWDEIYPFNEEYIYDMAPNILIVDDIVDFGTQYKKAKTALSKYDDQPDEPPSSVKIKYASLIYNVTNQSGIVPEYFGRTINKDNNEFDANSWYRFWWEND